MNHAVTIVGFEHPDGRPLDDFLAVPDDQKGAPVRRTHDLNRRYHQAPFQHLASHRIAEEVAYQKFRLESYQLEARTLSLETTSTVREHFSTTPALQAWCEGTRV